MTAKNKNTLHGKSNSTPQSKLHSKSLITLVGSPNSGKTTLFNHLSGRKSRTVNYPGATVEYSYADFLECFSVNSKILDSPGIISLIPSSPDEKVTIENLFRHKIFGTPDLFVVTLDASQLSRHLLPALQLKDTGVNVILVITMRDILNQKGYDIELAEIRSLTGCDAVFFDGISGYGKEELSVLINYHLNNPDIPDIIVTAPGPELKEVNLINLFRRIERISENVIIKYDNSSGLTPDITNANKSLVIAGYDRKGLNKPDRTTLKIDSFMLHKYWGIVIFLCIMAFTFTSIFWLASPVMNLIDFIFRYSADYFTDAAGDSWFSDFISNGIIGGTGGVLVFLPQIVILFFILGVLEDSGYLARGAMLIDKPLSKIGLNGRSFAPMLSGFACAIPAIMAARTIQNKRERYITIFIIPLMSCSARLPVYGLLVSYLFGDEHFYSGITLAAIYLFGILSSLVVAGFINKYRSSFIKVEDNSSFIMELPVYRIPQFGFVFKSTLDNSWQYVKKAGPIILSFSVVLWIFTYFPNPDPQFKVTEGLSTEQISFLKSSERISNSYAASFGKIIEPLMKPIGLDWRVGVSLIATFAAREVFVSSLALIFKVTENEGNTRESLVNAMHTAETGTGGKKLFTFPAIIGLIVFFVFALQCISTLAVTRKETGGWRIPIIQLAAYSILAYMLAFITFNGLNLLM
ncbi:MAG: ferrous iron transport protein B [Ignavibacteriae bacterium]|nr:ferrous iron transport protein B [Ignavibacteriota bacterium]